MPSRITFSIGLESVPSVAVQNDAFHYVSQAFGGYTATLGKGGWTSPQGNLIQESSLVIEVVVTEPDKLIRVRRVAERLRDMFEQQCVLVTKEELTEVEFV